MSMRTAKLAIVTILAAALGAACVSDHDLLSNYPELQVAFHDLQARQKQFAEDTRVPQTLDFKGMGTVTIRHLSLDGYPGNTYLRCRFHYTNTTGKPVAFAKVALEVLNGRGQLVAGQTSTCIFPSIRPIYQGTFFSDELRTKTMDAHLEPGWSWRITCRAEFEEPDSPGTR
jgi:hypothetical protein